MLFSCQNDSNTKTQEQLNQDFTMMSVEVLEELSSYYPSNNLGIKISKDVEGNLYTVYKLKGLNEE